FRFSFPEMPKLPSLPRFRTRDALSLTTSRALRGDPDEEEDLKPPVLLKIEPKTQEPDGSAPTKETTAPDVHGLASVATKETEPPQVRKEIVVKLPSMLKPRQVSPPPPPPRELGEYHLPNWDILADAEYGYAQSQET